MDFLKNHIEALIFCAEKPLSVQEIKSCLTEMFEAEVPLEHISESIDFLIQKYEDEQFSFAIYSMAGGYQFLTKPAYQTSLTILLKQASKKRLSASALETLSIIAYKQPISKSQAEAIRGVNCDYAIQKLLEKEIIEIKGKSDGPGRPLLYGTNDKFLEYFGINNISELPQPKDFAANDNEIGNTTLTE